MPTIIGESKCPNCDKGKGRSKYKCKKCDTVFCSDCGGGSCPECGSTDKKENW